MTVLEIDTERGHDNVEQQVRELETHELMSIYKLFAGNPTVWQLVSDELLWRKEHERQLEHPEQVDDIQALLHRPR
jgi:hypothetical protein